MTKMSPIKDTATNDLKSFELSILEFSFLQAGTRRGSARSFRLVGIPRQRQYCGRYTMSVFSRNQISSFASRQEGRRARCWLSYFRIPKMEVEYGYKEER